MTTPADAAYGPPAKDPLTQPLVDFLPRPEAAVATPAPAAARWPCLTCGSENLLEATNCVVCGAPFLAAVGIASRPTVVLPLVGDLARLSRAQRLWGAVGVLVVLLCIVALVSVVSGSAAPSSKPTDPATPPLVVSTVGPPTASPSDTPSATPSASVTPSPLVTVTP